VVALIVSAFAVGDPKPATSVTDISATLNGRVYSNVHGPTTYWFEFGKTTRDRVTLRRVVGIPWSPLSPH
jgi:hypothetical protein